MQYMRIYVPENTVLEITFEDKKNEEFTFKYLQVASLNNTALMNHIIRNGARGSGTVCTLLLLLACVTVAGQLL